MANLKMPQPEKNGFVATMNGMGYMTSGLDPYSKKFVDFASQSEVSLDIGAAYGVATLAAIEQGASRIIANDIDSRHLEILQERAGTKAEGVLELAPGSFPNGLDINTQSIDAILIARVLHFFSPEEIPAALKKLEEWMRPKAKLFIIVESPYLKNFSAFMPIFEQRKKAGQPWPGYIEDVSKIDPERAKNLPKTIHFFDPDTLADAVRNHTDLEVEECSFINRVDFPEDLKLDGRESVGLIARKK